MKFFISVILLFFVSQIEFNAVYGGKKYVSNLSTTCLKCLCHASTQCNMTVSCQKGFCGPLFITKEYWTDAGRPVLENDDPDRTNAFKDCAENYNCATTAVENYMAKYGLDCDNNGVTDCDDYARLHFHGKNKCTSSIENLNYGKRYNSCKPVLTFPRET